MESRYQTSLHISIQNCQFQKADQYYMTLQLSSETENEFLEKRRTDHNLSNTKTPEFAANSFKIPISGQKLAPYETVTFELYSLQKSHSAVFEGDCVLDIGSLDLSEKQTQQICTLVRRVKDRDQAIGQFVVFIRLSKEDKALKENQAYQQFEMQNSQGNDFFQDNENFQTYMREHEQFENNTRNTQKQQLSPKSQRSTLTSMFGDQDLQMSMKEKWELYSKTLQQKTELVHRFQKEYQEKQQTLQETGQTITKLRKMIKYLQKQKDILAKRVYAEEQIQAQTVVQGEIKQMSFEEVKQKIISVAQAYREERIRNQEFEKALKESEKEISKSAELEVELENLRLKHQKAAKVLSDLQDEISKKNIYDDAIQKQTKVIAKLQGMMENTLKNAEDAKINQQEIRSLQQDVDQITFKLREQIFGDHNSEIRNLRYENQKLENIHQQLSSELEKKQTISKNSNKNSESYTGQSMELQVRLHKATSRLEAIQTEMITNAKLFAQELSLIKLEVAQKQAQLDALTITSV